MESQNKDGSGSVYKHGWDYYFGEPNQSYNHKYYPDVLYRYDRFGLVGKKTDGKRLDVIKNIDPSSNKPGYSHDLVTENALAFIDAVKDEPFFLYIPYCVPHKKFEIPELEPYAEASSWSKNEKVYASMITHMDRDIGRIVKRLEKYGIDENTLVFFTSDNGPKEGDGVFNSTGGLPGHKGSTEDGGIRVPGIAYWPGTIQKNHTNDQLFAFWDIMPTCAALPPKPIDGISMAPTLLNKGKQPEHKYLIFGKRIIRGTEKTRSDKEIILKEKTEVVVPTFTPNG